MRYTIRSRHLVAALITTVVGIIPWTHGIASEEVVPSGHAVTITIPDGWERLTNHISEHTLVVAAERGTGNSLGLLGFEQPNAKYTLNRKEAEKGVLSALGPNTRILRRTDTKLAGASAYCVIVETEVQGRKISAARIIADKPVHGFMYVLQYSKIGGGNFDDASIQKIANQLRSNESR